MDSADYAADTNNDDIAAVAILHFSYSRRPVTHGCFVQFDFQAQRLS
jgi:hypothetical protein